MKTLCVALLLSAASLQAQASGEVLASWQTNVPLEGALVAAKGDAVLGWYRESGVLGLRHWSLYGDRLEGAVMDTRSAAIEVGFENLVAAQKTRVSFTLPGEAAPRTHDFAGVSDKVHSSAAIDSSKNVLVFLQRAWRGQQFLSRFQVLDLQTGVSKIVAPYVAISGVSRRTIRFFSPSLVLTAIESSYSSEYSPELHDLETGKFVHLEIPNTDRPWLYLPGSGYPPKAREDFAFVTADRSKAIFLLQGENYTLHSIAVELKPLKVIRVSQLTGEIEKIWDSTQKSSDTVVGEFGYLTYRISSGELSIHLDRKIESETHLRNLLEQVFRLSSLYAGDEPITSYFESLALLAVSRAKVQFGWGHDQLQAVLRSSVFDRQLEDRIMSRFEAVWEVQP